MLENELRGDESDLAYMIDNMDAFAEALGVE
jgi:hypothetical protein